MYSDELTEDEAKIGFTMVYLNNPQADFYAQLSIVPAVVYILGPCDLIIKFADPNENPSYSHQKYGTYGNSEGVDWKPVSVPFPTATSAIRSAQSGSDQIGPGAVEINIVQPSMPLRCPKCLREFRLAVDHVPFASRLACQTCSSEEDIGQFAAANL